MADSKGNDTKANGKNVVFTFDTVAVLVASILAKGGNLGREDYNRMSALDGTRGADGFDHLFRKVKQRAKELNKQAEDAGGLTPVKKTKVAAGSAKKTGDGGDASASSKKRGRKPKSTEEADDEESPTKKVKAETGEDYGVDVAGEPNYEFEF